MSHSSQSKPILKRNRLRIVCRFLFERRTCWQSSRRGNHASKTFSDSRWCSTRWRASCPRSSGADSSDAWPSWAGASFSRPCPPTFCTSSRTRQRILWAPKSPTFFHMMHFNNCLWYLKSNFECVWHTLYGEARMRSPNTTWPRFSEGELSSSLAWQKSKCLYSNGSTDSTESSRFTNTSNTDLHVSVATFALQ